MSANAVEIRGLTKAFSRFTLGPIDLTVPRGAIYGFAGPNGAGKSTTIDLIFGMGTADAGTIRVLGFDHAADEVEVKRRAAYVSPDLSYLPWRRVHKAIGFVRGFYPDWDQRYCDELLARLDLDPGASIQTLSLGARTKLALVLALARRPAVLILDEPTIGLDALSRQAVFAELMSAVEDEERSVLISSHDLGGLERFADHLGIIKDGAMLLEGRTDSLIARFRMVDATTARPASIRVPGVTILEQEGLRCRLLVDLDQVTLDSLTMRGATVLAETPVTLEALFIALAQTPCAV